MRSNRQSCLQISSLFQVTLSLTSVLLNPSGKKAGAGRPPLWVSLFPPCIQNSGQHPAHAPRRPPALPSRNRSISAIVESRVSFMLISILPMINPRVPPNPPSSGSFHVGNAPFLQAHTSLDKAQLNLFIEFPVSYFRLYLSCII